MKNTQERMKLNTLQQDSASGASQAATNDRRLADNSGVRNARSIVHNYMK